jgi:stress-induced-phosphoprotein 1
MYTCWILKAFLDMGISQEYLVAHEFCTRAIEVIEWGRAIWKDIPREDKGSIFELTFLRAVRALRMDASMNVWLTIRIPQYLNT